MKTQETDILNLFQEKSLNADEQTYLQYHYKRMAFTTSLVEQFINYCGSRQILDIGPHFLTYCMSQLIKPAPVISTIGFREERLFPSKLAKKHYEFDLNRCADVGIPCPEEKFDLIVFSETIEHLHTSPKIVLSFLSKLLKNEGKTGILIQTPNAVSLSKRIRMALGQNPFELIREDKTNPGHFREYTLKELERYALEAGFKIWYKQYCSYWSGNNILKHVIDSVPSFRDGITMLIIKE